MALKNRLMACASGAVRRLARDNKGGVAVTFGLAFPAIAFLSLVAVDYSRASSARQALQDTLDAAALIVARSTAIQPDDVDAVGDKAFAAQLPGDAGIEGFTPNQSGRLSNVTFTPVGNKIVGVANGEVEPLVASVFLNGAMDIGATSEVVRTVNKLEIALVLDTTGSMQGTKLTNLIAAAKDFVTTMQTAAARSTETNPVKISVVPFSQTVRVSGSVNMANYNNSTHSMTGLPTWLDGRNLATSWDNDIFTNANSNASNRADRFEMLRRLKKFWGGCVEARMPPFDIRETAPTSSDVNTLFAPYFWPDESDAHSHYLNDYLADVTSNSNWKTKQGYTGKYYDGVNFKSGTAEPNTFIPASAYGAGWLYGPNAACNMQQVKRLSTDFNGIRDHIDGLVASGETNIPIGLMWGWHSLSPQGPWSDGVAYGAPNTTKIIVLMTDGDNTMNDTTGSSNSNNSYYHGYGYVWQGKLPGINGSSSASARTTAMNNRLVPPSTNPSQESLCGNIKARNIQIYTVGVGVSSSSKTLLTKCATAADFYYDVDSQAGNLNAVFSAIAGRIENLRISH